MAGIGIAGRGLLRICWRSAVCALPPRRPSARTSHGRLERFRNRARLRDRPRGRQSPRRDPSSGALARRRAGRAGDGRGLRPDRRIGRAIGSAAPTAALRRLAPGRGCQLGQRPGPRGPADRRRRDAWRPLRSLRRARYRGGRAGLRLGPSAPDRAGRGDALACHGAGRRRERASRAGRSGRRRSARRPRRRRGRGSRSRGRKTGAAPGRRPRAGAGGAERGGRVETETGIRDGRGTRVGLLFPRAGRGR